MNKQTAKKYPNEVERILEKRKQLADMYAAKGDYEFVAQVHNGEFDHLWET